MARTSFRDFLIGFFRRSKWLYRVVRWGWRRVRDGCVESIRFLTPILGVRGLPKGTFCLLDKVRSGAVRGEIFFERQEVPVFEPGSLVKKSGLKQDEFQPWPVFWAQIDNARLAGPNLVLMDDQKRACVEGMFREKSVPSDESYNSPVFSSPKVLEGNWISLVSRWDSGYWHFMMDAVTRLHVLDRLPPDTQILVRAPIAAWQRDVLRMVGVADRVRETTGTHIKPEHYYFSSFTSMAGAYNPFAVDFLRTRMLPFAVEPAADLAREKIYIHRAGWTRGIVNDQEVTAFFEARGWLIVEPETLSVREQMGLFKQAKVICGVHGSALTNLLWVEAGTKVLELCGDNFMLGSFEWLARCVGAEHRFLLCRGNHRLSIQVDILQLEDAVTRLLLESIGSAGETERTD